MDPDALVEALRGTMDPNLREAAELQLNEVKVEANCDVSCGAVSVRASAVHNIKMVRSNKLSSAGFNITDPVLKISSCVYCRPVTSFHFKVTSKRN